MWIRYWPVVKAPDWEIEVYSIWDFRPLIEFEF